MKAVTNHRGKTVLVVGAGRSGLAVAHFLLEQEARVILTDSRDRTALDSDMDTLIESSPDGMLELELGGHPSGCFTRCDFVVVSPGVPLILPEFELSRKAGIPIISEVELAFRNIQGKIIGITGSNGKTTTTALVVDLLKGAGVRAFAAGNIGFPLTGFVPESTPEDVYVVELSSFQLESIDLFRPGIGAILNITPDHMDRYEAFPDYAAAKRRLFMNQEPTDYAVLNADDPEVASIAAEIQSTPALFSRWHAVRHGTFVRNTQVVFRDEDRDIELFPVDSIQLPGAHNIENVLAACTMAILAGVPPESLETGIRQFKGVEHRIEFVAEIAGVRYFNDSKATNIDAAIKSVEAFPGNILLIAGGRDKGGDFNLLRDPIRRRVRRLVLIGEAADAIRRALNGTVQIHGAGSMQEAVNICKKYAQPGDIVLLAPACASFDMFRDYEHRGQVFKEVVRRQLS